MFPLLQTKPCLEMASHAVFAKPRFQDENDEYPLSMALFSARGPLCESPLIDRYFASLLATILLIVRSTRQLVNRGYNPGPCAVRRALGLDPMGEQVVESGYIDALSLESTPLYRKMQHLPHGGPSPRFGYATPPPPPPRPPGPLSYQGSIATGHTYGGAEGARKFFFHSPCPRSIPPRPGGGAPQRYT